MEKKNTAAKPVRKKPEQPVPTEQQAREVLAKPPRDRREVTIGPTDKTGPDITLG